MKHIIAIIIAFVSTATLTTALGQTTDTLKTATVKVSGITCSGDLPLIKKKLINKEGIDEVSFAEIKGETVIFTVNYHSSITSETKIQEYIEAAPSCDNPNEYPYKAKAVHPKAKKR